MATAQMETVIRHLRRAVTRQDGPGQTDGQLLASFIDQKDDGAFAALVRRHGPMVFGVCRRVVRNYHDAEDAFQATFLVLARNASKVRPRERVASWLHGVALRTAMKANALTAKRRGREQQVAELPEPSVVQQDPVCDLLPLLDRELNGLPEYYRLPVLLCDLEGKTIKEATQQLGWPQGTLAGRLARGRKLLARRLANRGVTLSAGLLAAVVSQNVASAAVPISLVSSTVKAAAMVAAGQAIVAGVVPAKVAVLMEGVLNSMLLSKLKTVLVVLLLVATVGTGGGWLSRGTAQTGEEQLPRVSGERPSRTPDGQLFFPFVDSGTIEGNADNRLVDSPDEIAELQAEKTLAMAAYYQRTGKLDAAVFYYQIILDRYPSTGSAPKALQRLEDLKKQRTRGTGEVGTPPRVRRIIVADGGTPRPELRKKLESATCKGLQLFPGQVLDEESLRLAEKNVTAALNAASLYDGTIEVTIGVIDTDDPGFKDVVVTVRKKSKAPAGEENKYRGAGTEFRSVPDNVPGTDLDQLQGVWLSAEVVVGGEKAGLEKVALLVDGKRACWQTSDMELRGGLYLSPSDNPRTFDLATSARTIEGIYLLKGDRLVLCYDLGPESKRPVNFKSEKGTQQVLVKLQRIHGPEVFPFRLVDGTRTFPSIIPPARDRQNPPMQLPPRSGPNGSGPVQLALPFEGPAPERQQPGQRSDKKE
jgi:RNA polymerase sigma factor (sigma-70 family)